MKSVLILASILLSTSCGMSSKVGKYSGILIDVSYSGVVFKSCELAFKTDLQASNSNHASMIISEQECLNLNYKLGKKHVITYKNSILNFKINTGFIITSMDLVE